MTTHEIDVQIACVDKVPVSTEQLTSWIGMTLDEHQSNGELTLRLVDTQEILELNSTYRKQNKPTNVLAFPSSIPDTIELDHPFLGDVVVCPAVLQSEAMEQKVPLEAHWAHIVIHGVLHLLGYDHIEEDDAIVMQKMEIKLLGKLKFANPYLSEGITSE